MTQENNLGTIETSNCIASLTYRSEAATPPLPAELEDLLRRARARNHNAGVTGMLVYDKGRFLQTLEGPPEAVEAIWLSIRHDPRHRSIEVLKQHIVPARLFCEWDMQLFARDDVDHRPVAVARGAGQLVARVPDVVRYVLAGDSGRLNALVSELVTAGWLSQTLVKHLLEPAARRLGDAFITDDCTECDLTIGLGMLQIAGHALHDRWLSKRPARPSPYCAVVVPAPGEPHLLGPSLLGELFINAGWAVVIAFPETDAALAKLLVAQQPDVIDIALSDALPRHQALVRLRATIDACRTTVLRNPVIVSVGGRAFAEFGATDKSVGADHARASSAGAIGSLTKLVQNIF